MVQKVYNKLAPQGLSIIYYAAGLLAAGLALLALSLLPLKLMAMLAGGVALLCLVVWRPVMGLAAVCLMLPLEGITAAGTGVTETRLLGMAVFGAWALNTLIRWKQVETDRAFWAAALFAAWAGVSFLWIEEIESSTAYYGTLIQLLLLYLMAINVIESRRQLHLVLGSWILGAVGSTVLSFNLFVTNVFERARTFEAQNPNDYGLIIGFGIVAGVYLAGTSRKGWQKLLCILASSFLTFPLLLAQSRTSWVAVLAASVVFLWNTRHRLRNLVMVLIVAAGVVLVTFSLGFVQTSLIQRSADLVAIGTRGTARFDIWRVAAVVFREHPLTGVGFRQFTRVYNRYRYQTRGITDDLFPARDPHSIYFGVAAELGLIGLLLLFNIFWQTRYAGGAGEANRSWITLALLAFLIISGIGMNNFYAKYFWLGLAICARTAHFGSETTAAERDAE